MAHLERTDSEVPLYTAGYGMREIDEFLDLLEQYQIAFLIDVRSQPYSRFKPEYGKHALQRATRQRGIRYVFMGDLLGGRPEDPACYTAGKVDYSKFQATGAFQRGLARLQKAWRQQQRVVLMCSEGKPEACHRSKLIGDALERAGIPVLHIDEAGEPRRQAEIMGRLTQNQTELFGGLPSSATSISKRSYRDETE